MRTPSPGVLKLSIAAALALAFAVQVAASVSRDSATWDEGNHLYSGLRIWTRGDFGLNPEHPPLVKLVATAPLLSLGLRIEEPRDLEFVKAAFLGGRALLLENDPAAILLRARLAVAIFAALLAAFAFLLARTLLGTWAGLAALAVLAFEPNVLGHSGRATSDVAVSAFLLGTIWAFLRYLAAPGVARLAVAGVLAGLALATKHTAVLLFPMLALLAAGELLPGPGAAGPGTAGAEPPRRRAARLAGALVAIGLLAVAILWASYGFRYAARPAGLAMNPPLAEYVKPLGALDRAVLGAFASSRLLPEAWLQGSPRRGSTRRATTASRSARSTRPASGSTSRSRSP
ncbi:MAG: glycosyltransferase family 39 protein [Anaeromyxobacteraceae bacterium]